MGTLVTIPHLGPIPKDSGFIPLKMCSDGQFAVGKQGVVSITATGDGRVEFIAFERHTLAYVTSTMGYPAYYPVHPVKLEKPIEAVVMDLDGTTVRSEQFWIWIIQRTTANLLGDPTFKLENTDLPFVSGHSVSEHLQHCIQKYCPRKTVEDARQIYFETSRRELHKIREGRGRSDAFVPTPGLKEFLYSLKDMGVKIGLVTSGLYEKAYPAMRAAFRDLNMGDPQDFYDGIITAGFPLGKGEIGTLGELSPKPHPWLYAELCRVGLGIPFAARNRVVGIEDSGAGVCAIRLAGFPPIGISGGNIVASGTRALCEFYKESFAAILEIIR
jgi:beta-phosphoglucomutase-like phosphatase (HAD superfamily)